MLKTVLRKIIRNKFKICGCVDVQTVKRRNDIPVMIIVQACFSCQILTVIDIDRSVDMIIRSHILTSDRASHREERLQAFCRFVDLAGQERMFVDLRKRKKAVAAVPDEMIECSGNIFACPERRSRLEQDGNVVRPVMFPAEIDGMEHRVDGFCRVRTQIVRAQKRNVGAAASADPGDLFIVCGNKDAVDIGAVFRRFDRVRDQRSAARVRNIFVRNAFAAASGGNDRKD